MKIETITPRQILDSRGNPTVEVDVELANGSFGRAAVPSGASTGEHEAHELRDGGSAYHGRGVDQAINNINRHIAPALIGHDATDQTGIDSTMTELDGTDNKSTLGANAILGVSMAVARAAANAKQVPLYEYIGQLHDNSDFNLPQPMINIINGGQHASGSTEIQEFMIIPQQADDFSTMMRCGSEIFHQLKQLLAEQGLATTVGD